jgi:D-inositol-3-phosphate glycosyltransferase
MLRGHTVMQTPIAILCSSSAWGGLELNVLRLARWLKAAGKEVLLIGKAETPLAVEAERNGVDFHAIRPTSRYFDYASVKKMRALAEAQGVGALIVNTNADLFRAVMTKVFTHTPLKVAYLQHMQIGQAKRDLYHTWLYKKLDAWISPLAGLAKQVLQLTRLAPEKMHVVPLGIELRQFERHTTDRSEARRALGLPQDTLIAGIVGRLDPQKNQAMLLRAAAQLIHEGLPLKILIVGANTLDNKSDYQRELEILCAELQISESVFFRPFMQDPGLAYAALDVFVLTSEKETYGMVTIEAMAAGLPVLATRSGGTPELVDDGQTGILFDPQNDEGLRTSLRLLIQDGELRARLGRAGQQKAALRFSHEQQIAGVLRAIDA